MSRTCSQPAASSTAPPGSAPAKRAGLRSTGARDSAHTRLGPSQQHRNESRAPADAAEESSGSDYTELDPLVTKRRAQPSNSQEAAPKASPRSLAHIVLANAMDCDLFTNLVELAGGLSRQNRILEIYLDAGKVDDLYDFRLAVALNALHPRNDGKNPHLLRAIKIVLKGPFLYTRYSYHLASPALSEDVSGRLARLATGGLSEDDKLNLAYAITSTEKSVAKAILGIRSIKHVVIEGLGKMEEEFVQVVKNTLTQPPGTLIAEPSGNDPAMLSTLQLYGQGTAVSLPYYLKGERAKRQVRNGFHPYATRTITRRHEFSSLSVKQRYLIDEKKQLIGHFLCKTNAEAREMGVVLVPKSHIQRWLRKVVVDDGSFIGRTRGYRGRMAAPERKRDRKEKLGMENMVRFRMRKEKKNIAFDSNDQPKPKRLTDLVNTVELGWKLR